MKIAVITDLHYAKEKNIACPGRAGERAKELLNAAIEKLNTEIKPDILLVGGDLVNNADDAPLLEELAEIFRKLPYPQLIIPGNHDPAPDVFYQFFPPKHFPPAMRHHTLRGKVRKACHLHRTPLLRKTAV